MDKIYYLASCDTCRKIIKNLPKTAELEFQDIRQNPITEEQLEELYQLAGSYEAASYADGPQEIQLTFAELEPYLKVK